jgi:uncharacterized membrane protein
VTHEVLAVLIASASPISELRGGIPLGIALGLQPVDVFVLSVVTNILIFFPARAVLALFYRGVLRRLPLFDRYLLRVRRTGAPAIEKYGLLGLVLFVGIPLPFTGAYTGTVLSWLLAMDVKRSFLGVVGGVLVAGVIVMGITLGLVHGLPALPG